MILSYLYYTSEGCLLRAAILEDAIMLATQVLNLVCADCGKPCRSTTEQDLHTKRTGHKSFVDKVLAK